MVYAGETPWHGLGTRLPANGTWEEIRTAAGFYRAQAVPLSLPNGTLVPDRKAIIREDSGQYLATVGEGYEIVQFEDLAHAGVIAAGDVQAIWHTAGTLGENGARGWLLAELPEPIRVTGDKSVTKKYVLLTTAHDGTGAAVLMNCATRVVCRNTLGVALREVDGARWSIRHTKNAPQRLKDAAIAFRNMAEHLDKFEQLANVLVRRPYSEALHAEAIAALLPIPEDDKPHPKLEKSRKAVEALFDTFTGNEGIRGTAWGAFQAWTEFVDHRRYALEQAQREKWDRRVEALALGSGADLKAQALTTIINQVSIGAADFVLPA